MIDPADHIPLVRLVAGNVANHLRAMGHDVEFSELVSDGYLGLMDAVRLYDSSKGKFSTLAVPRIRGAMLDGRRGPLSRSKKYFVDIPLHLRDTAPSIIHLVNEPLLKSAIAAAMDRPGFLSPNQKTAIRLKYWHDMTNRQIADELHVVESRVSQLLKKAHDKLAAVLSSDDLHS